MELMYKEIANALNAQQIEDQSPKDYLTFFCLGNQETKTEGEYVPTQSPEDNSHYKNAQDNRRFMIYVHAKMMIGERPEESFAAHALTSSVAGAIIFLSFLPSLREQNHCRTLPGG
jgi:phospholipase D1/2